MKRSRSPQRRGALLAALLVLAGSLLSGCGASANHGHGSVAVLYAASLEQLMDSRVAPAFHRATGYTFTGYPAGSKELASEIQGRVRRGDVFISASPAVDRRLEGASGGGWVSWYAPFASTRLVLGYNPRSSFAARLKRGPWYRVIAAPGFRLGFTDPRLDPKGGLSVAALDQAARLYHEPALARIATDTADLFPEEDLVGRLQSGQLDAGFFYTVEASAAHIPAVSLAPIDERGAYTITVLNRAVDRAGALAFVRFLLGARGQAQMRSVGLELPAHPAAVGHGRPAALSGVIAASAP
jgi:molybdate/tungstate transport system substrate-binding protein